MDDIFNLYTQMLGLYQLSQKIMATVFQGKFLSKISINYTHANAIMFFAIGSILFIAMANQVSLFVSYFRDRPLPLKEKILITLMRLAKYALGGIFIYMLAYNLILSFQVYYLIHYNPEYHSLSFLDYFTITQIIKSGISTLLVLIFIHFKLKLPVFEILIDRIMIKPLDELSKLHFQKNSGKKIYNAEGTKRVTKDYKIKKYLKNRNYLFHGLDENNKPIYTDFQDSLNGHTTVIGGTGMGKGTITRMYLKQTIDKNITNIIVDPKPDDYMFDACCTFAKENNKKVHIIDLDNKEPQISLFKNMDKDEFIKVINSSLEFQAQKQSNAKVYAARGELLILKIADEIYKENITPSEMMEKFKMYPEIISDDILMNFFTQVERSNVFNTKNGVNFKDLLESGNVIYIRCKDAKKIDASRDLVQLTMMTIFEHIEKRNPHNATQCLMVIDEFKFIMNSVIMNNLATVRSQKCSLVFNFQDLSNFMTSPNYAMRNESYATELLSNSKTIVVHDAKDIKLAKLIQQSCGEAEYDKYYEDSKTNAGGTSETSHERKWTKEKNYKLTINEITQGNPRTAILINSTLDEGFKRTHTMIIDTDNYEFRTNTVSPKYKVEQRSETKTKANKEHNFIEM
jgi:hypothetical protein